MVMEEYGFLPLQGSLEIVTAINYGFKSVTPDNRIVRRLSPQVRGTKKFRYK
jgi:hypothetical protein